MSDLGETLLEVSGPAAPPRTNGELVFSAPWERQLFGMTMALVDRGVFEYEAFRELLISEIGKWDAGERPAEDWSYYRCWAAALERLLVGGGLVDSTELQELVDVFAKRPHGHDH